MRQLHHIYSISLLCLFTGLHGLPCSYQHPRVEDVVIGVSIGDEHQNADQPVHAHRKRREAGKYRPLRIHLHYDETVRQLPDDKQLYINGTLLPEAAGFWTKALKVRRNTGALTLKPKCVDTYYLYDKQLETLSCGRGCAAATQCGDTPVPPEHLQACRYCADSGASCKTSGKTGKGVPNTDFILYISARETPRCDRNDTIAYAAHCQLEKQYDRPIAGHVNLCPTALSLHAHDQEVLSSTIKHEILHALGFSAGLFAFWRDENGKPRTKRSHYGKPLEMDRAKGYYKWDKNTINNIARPDWWTADGSVVHVVQMMVTPKVREEARRHFNCASLEGAELENQGGDGTALTHWEKRVFENEAMTGTHTQNPVYSRITFALLEDTGWYKPDYSMAEDFHWGKGLGCEFSMKSCGEWIKRHRDNFTSLQPFCDHVKHDGSRSLAVTRCTLQRDSVALCNLIPYNQPLPREYRNIDYLAGVQKGGLKYYGGSVELADFCPYNQEFEWKSDRQKRRDSRCEFISNSPEEDDLLEVYGDSSRCFDFPRPWTEKKCGRVRSFAQYLAGCYEHSCLDGVLHIGVFNSSSLYPCYYPGQHIHIKRITTDGWLREGSLICPQCSELCSSCNETLPIDIPEYIGDAHLDEPCSCHNQSIFIVLLLLAITLLCLN